MKSAVAVLAILLLVCPSGIFAECEPGDTKWEGMEFCICTGMRKWGCGRQAQMDRSPGCVPGSVSKEDCNTCICMDDGSLACTLMMCPGSTANDWALHVTNFGPKGDRKKGNQPTINRPCVPGSVSKEDCNTCICMDDGSLACTLMMCPPGLPTPPSWALTAGNRPRRRRGTSLEYAGPAERWDSSVSLPEADLATTDRDAECSPEEMEDPVKKCECVQEGYGSAEDIAQCLLLQADEGVRRKRNIQGIAKKYDERFCISTVRKDGTGCVPGTTFMVDCHKCMCKQSGMSAVCIRRNCRQKLLEECAPGSMTAVECNTCICSKDRKWACTRNECKPRVLVIDCEEKTSRKTRSSTSRGKCVPGTSLMVGCSRCYCNEDGVSAICKTRNCNGVRGKILQLESIDDDDDEGGGDGGVGVVIGPGGIEIYQPQVTCDTNWIAFQNESTICVCVFGVPLCASINFGNARTGRGNDLGPFALPIPPGIDVSRNATHACLKYKQFSVCLDLQANAVALGGSGFGGSRDVVEVPLPPESVVFQNDTYICIIFGGTNMCLDLEAKQIVAGFKSSGRMKRATNSTEPCQPKTTFKQSCNTCYCNAEGTGAVCTLYKCDTSGQIDWGTRCLPDTIFKRDCNFCYCNKDGTDVICTSRVCPSEKTSDDGHGPELPSYSQKCEPNTTFKVDCNMCLCGRYGHAISCTRLDCSSHRLT